MTKRKRGKSDLRAFLQPVVEVVGAGTFRLSAGEMQESVQAQRADADEVSVFT